ncbi:MAG: hypothetical protein LBR78_00880 [Holosporales bacterium]|jgi:hypothetical protein|nr:hypothetical protein [Holosporales bacterium]
MTADPEVLQAISEAERIAAQYLRTGVLAILFRGPDGTQIGWYTGGQEWNIDEIPESAVAIIRATAQIHGLSTGE